jgi:hypothetical protein
MTLPRLRRMITLAPDKEAPFSPRAADSMIGDHAELSVGQEKVTGIVAESTLRPDGHIELILELDAVPGSREANLVDGFDLQFWTGTE